MVTASFISTLWFAFPPPPLILGSLSCYLLPGFARDRLLETRRMLLAVGSPVLMAVAFPRSVFGKHLDLNVGLFAALLGTAFEKLFKIIDVLSVPVGTAAAGPSAPPAAARRRAPRAVRRTCLKA